MFDNNFKTICESLNFVGYINCDPKPEFLNRQGITTIDEALFKITGLRIKSVSLKDVTGLAKPIYERSKDTPLTNDSGWTTIIKLRRNKKLLFFACINNRFSLKDIDNIIIPFF